MKRFLLFGVLGLGLALAPAARAQQAEAAHEGAAHEGDPLLNYKWINFAVLAAGLGYLIVAKGMPALNERSRAIEKALKAADQIKADAAAEEAAIDRKMSALKDEVAQMRASAKAEMEAEAKRLAAETETLVAKLQANAAAEVATMTKQSQMALKAKASELALALAHQKVTGKMNAETNAGLITGFVNDLKQLQGAPN